MKTILRILFLNLIVMYLAFVIYPGLSYDGTLKTLLLAAAALTLLSRIVQPLIKLLLLPINLLTLGFFGWVTHVATLFLLTRAVKGVVVSAFYFQGFGYNGFTAPPMQISLLASYVLGSLTISLINSMISWLLRK